MQDRDPKDIELPHYIRGVLEKHFPSNASSEELTELTEANTPVIHVKASMKAKTIEQPIAQENDKLGIFISLLTPVIFVTSSTLTRFLPGVPPMQLVFLRALLTILPFYAYFHYTNKVDELLANLKNQILHLNGFFATIAGYMLYLAMSKLSISETFTIYSTSGLLNGFLGSLILREPYSKQDKLLGGLSFLGVILIVRPPFIFGKGEEDSPYNTETTISHAAAGVCAFLSAASFSLYQIGVRASRKNASPYVTSFYVNASSIFWLGLYFLFHGDYKSLAFSEYLGCFIFGAVCLGGFIAISYALKYAPASVVGLLGYTQLVYTLLVDICIFGDFPSLLTIIGATLIVGSSIYLIMKNK